MVQSVMCAEASPSPTQPVSQVLVPVADVCAGLLELFAQVSDGRCDQGRDHPVAAVLALAAAATVAGMCGFTAIAGWVADVPAQVRRDLYARAGGNARVGAPSKATIWRVLTGADAEAFDAAVGAWLIRGLAAAVEHTPASDTDRAPLLMQVRLDGKTLRSAVDADGGQMHLLAALVGRPGQATVVAAQSEVGAKTNEVPMAIEALDRVDLADTVFTADALHTVKATAGYIYGRGGHFMLPVKENRRALFDACDALPWTSTPVTRTRTEVGHGRITRRTIRVLAAPRRSAVSPRRPGVSGGTLRHPHRHRRTVRCGRARSHQPA